ncbi:fuseless [Carabus blaptoides fortunei]
MRGSTAGLTDSLKGRSHTHYALLSVLDTVFSALVVAPAVVGYWRSTWALTTFYLYPQYPLKSAVISLGIGIGGHLVFGISQHTLARQFHPDKHRILYYAASRLYTACYAFTCVNSWRAAWEFLDRYTEGESTTVLATTFVSVIVLAAMRGLRNVSAAPFSIAMDYVHGYFEVPTMFKTTSSDKTSLYILDCLFSVFVIGTLVVFVWRGAWILLDLFIYPQDFKWSSWISLILGYTIVAMAFSMQPAMRWLCDRCVGVTRVIVADAFLLFSVIGTINVWRGIWNLLDIYFLPDHPEISCWITHCVSLRSKQKEPRQHTVQTTVIMYSVYVLFALVVTTTTQLVYPEEDPVTSRQNKDDRKPFYAPGMCPENQLYYPGDQVKDWVCDCAPSFVYYPPKDKCYHVYKQGPCNPNEYLILKKSDIIPKCVQNPCANDTMVLFNGKCQKLHTANGCPPLHLGGGTLEVNATSLQLECVPSNAAELSIIVVPNANCAPGSKRSATVAMGAQDAGPVVSVEFEVFGQVQGVYFTKYCRDMSEQLEIGGWIKNSKKGTIVGKMQGNRQNIEQMIVWLSKTGSPGSKIDHCELTNWENLARPEFRGFSIRF